MFISVAKIRSLAAAWARKDHRLANRLLSQSTQFGLVEVLKALTLLDSGRKIREWEKRMKRIQMQPKVKAKKIGQIKSNIDNLGVIRPKVCVTFSYYGHTSALKLQIPFPKFP